VLRMVEYEAAAGKTPSDLTKFYESTLKAKFVDGMTASSFGCVFLETQKGVALAMVLPSEADLDNYRAGLREQLVTVSNLGTYMNLGAQPIPDHSAKIEFTYGSLPKTAPFGFARFLQYKIKPGKLAAWNGLFMKLSKKVSTIPGLTYMTSTAATAASMQTTMMMVFQDKAAAEEYSRTVREEFLAEMKDAVDLTGPAKGAQFMLEANTYDIITK